jgi:hypothetical protein
VIGGESSVVGKGYGRVEVRREGMWESQVWKRRDIGE